MHWGEPKTKTCCFRAETQQSLSMRTTPCIHNRPAVNRHSKQSFNAPPAGATGPCRSPRCTQRLHPARTVARAPSTPQTGSGVSRQLPLTAQGLNIDKRSVGHQLRSGVTEVPGTIRDRPMLKSTRTEYENRTFSRVSRVPMLCFAGCFQRLNRRSRPTARQILGHGCDTHFPICGHRQPQGRLKGVLPCRDRWPTHTASAPDADHGLS